MRKQMRIWGWIGTALAVVVCASLLVGCGKEDKTAEAQQHFKIGVQYFEEKQMDEALTELRKAVELDPKFTDARFNLGGLYHALKAYSLAVKEYQEVLRLNPNYPRVHTALANLYYERGLMSWGRAVKFDRMAFWFPDTLRTLTHQDRAGLLKLIEQYHKTVKSDSVDAETHSKLSQAYFVLAAEEYRNAIEANASDTTAQLYLGLTYSEQGYPQKAMAQYEVLKNTAPNAAELLLGVLTQKDREKKQMEEFKRQGKKQ